MVEHQAFNEIRELANQLEVLNNKLEEENQKMKRAIILLTDAVDEILPFVVTDEQVIERARAANYAARLTVIGE